MNIIKDVGIIKKEGTKRGERYCIFKCDICGSSVTRIKKDGIKAKFCSHVCYAKNRIKRGAYKKRIISKKYIYIYMPSHPNAIGTKKLYIAEHRLKIEEKIGRYLTDKEIVHHKNENTMDNRIENLQLMTNSEHIKYHKSKSRRNKYGRFKV